MSSRNQYKALLTTTKQELQKAKKVIVELNDNITCLMEERLVKRDTITLLKTELKRVRSRKWFQFWKFFKCN